MELTGIDPSLFSDLVDFPSKNDILRPALDIPKPDIYKGLEPIALAYYEIDCSDIIPELIFDLHVLKFKDKTSGTYLLDCIDLGLVATGEDKSSADSNFIQMIDAHLIALFEEKNLGKLVEHEIDEVSLKYYHLLKREIYREKAYLIQERLSHPEDFALKIESKILDDTKIVNQIYVIRKAQEWIISEAA